MILKKWLLSTLYRQKGSSKILNSLFYHLVINRLLTFSHTFFIGQIWILKKIRNDNHFSKRKNSNSEQL